LVSFSSSKSVDQYLEQNSYLPRSDAIRRN